MILIHAFARELRNGGNNPKNYPWWPELITLLQADGHQVIQVGLPTDCKLVEDFRCLPLNELAVLIKECTTWIAVDSFFQHYAWSLGRKGIVLFGRSDPRIFGHSQNLNLFVDESYFRPDQFHIWEQCEYIAEAFCPPDQIYKQIKLLLNKNPLN